MSRYQLIIFDLDGTLIDSKKDISTSVNYTRQKIGLNPLNHQVIESYVGSGVTHLLEKTFETKDPQIIQKALSIFKERYLNHCLDETRLYPHVLEVLQKISNKFVLSILTNKPQEFTDKIINGLGVRDFFWKTLSTGNEIPQKPDAYGCVYLMRERRVHPNETLFVGDSIVDVQTAQNAGIDMAFTSFGFGDIPSEKERVKYVLSAFSELLEIV